GYTPPAVSIIQASGKRGDAERGLSWRQALEQGRHLMSYQARSLGFTVQREIMLRFIPRDEAWLYRTHGSRDVLHRRGATDLYFDAHTGRLRALQLPTGEGAGQAVTSWLYALHVADVWGWPLRVVVLILGVVLAMLSMTGVLIWRRKRMAENRSAGE
ncbi:MAG: PepSY domain-containing protein, partial [Burkholderiales bacterium]